MKSIFSLLFLFHLLQFTSLAQGPQIMWTKTFGGPLGDYGQSVDITLDGGFVIAGTTDNGPNYLDIGVLKTDSVGNLIWFRTFGGPSTEEGKSVIQTMDGGYIVVGRTQSFGAGGIDVWLIKTNADGVEQWNKTYGGTDNDLGESIKQLSNGDFIITGFTESYGAGLADVLLLRVDSNGNPYWMKTFGGPLSDYGQSVDITSDGGFIVTGYQNSFTLGQDDVSLLKTDSNGNMVWIKNFGGQDADRGYQVKQTTDGGYIFTGYTKSFGAGGNDVWLIKTDSLGNEQWSNTFGGAEHDVGYSVDQTLDGGYIVTGHQKSITAGEWDIGLLKTDSDGNLLWFQNIGGAEDDLGRSVIQVKDGGYIIVGRTASFGVGESDVYLVRMEPEVTTVKDETTLLYYNLSQNYPNPFNPSTKIKYSIPQSTNVVIKVFDVLGNEIETLVNQEKPTGTYEITWDAANLPSGIYFYRIQAGSFIDTKKMILLK